jgi:hypothetical protein
MANDNKVMSGREDFLFLPIEKRIFKKKRSYMMWMRVADKFVPFTIIHNSTRL